MIQLQLFCPSELNRRPQAFIKFHGFKGTEFRKFLLYTSPAVVKNVIDENYYKHLMIPRANVPLSFLQRIVEDLFYTMSRFIWRAVHFLQRP